MPVSVPDRLKAFHKAGLRTRSWRRSPPSEESTVGARFRASLDESGGIYAAFGQFLAWRTDLIGSLHLEPFRRGQPVAPGIARAAFARAIGGEVGRAGDALADSLDLEPCWSTPTRCAYRASYQGAPVVVQLAHHPIPESDFEEFNKTVSRLNEAVLERATAPAALRQFREWFRAGESCERERSYLEVLASLPKTATVQYPELLPELCGGRMLCWRWVEGEPFSKLTGRQPEQALERAAEAVLEQLCLLSIVDGCLDLDALALTTDGRIAVRRAACVISIPPGDFRSTLKYVAAVLAGHAADASHLLAKLAVGHPDPDVERQLLHALAGLEPDLKVNLSFPPSASEFESNWRALARVAPKRPLFLDLLHRNMVALGYWSAEQAKGSGDKRDHLAEAAWPVLGRLLRTRAGELATRDSATEWVLGSGLLFMEGMRQMNRLADGIRDNDLSVAVTGGSTEEGSRQANRVVYLGILAAMLLIAFFGLVRLGAGAPQPWPAILGVMAILAGAGLFRMMSRIG